MPFVEFKSNKLHYIDSGNKSSSVITFIHGWTASSKVYASQIDYFTPKYRVIAIDLLGHGDSDQPSPSEAGQLYNHSGFQDSVVALLAHLSIESTILVGWSLGAQVACEIARKWPDKVSSLILIGASPLFFLATNELTFPAFPKSAAEGLLISLSTSFEEVYQGLVFGFFPEYIPGKKPVPGYIETQLQDTAKVGGTIAHRILSLVGVEDFRSRIPEITTRTLIIHGGKDGLTPPGAGQWMFDHLGTSDKKFILYEEAGHAVFLGPTADQFNKDVEVFLESK